MNAPSVYKLLPCGACDQFRATYLVTSENSGRLACAACVRELARAGHDDLGVIPWPPNTKGVAKRGAP